MSHRLSQLPVSAKLTVTFFLMLLGGGYLAAVSLIFLGSIGKGDPPTNEDIQHHYGGVRREVPPPKPGEAPPRNPTTLESKIDPGAKNADGKVAKRPGSMWEYLTRTKNEESRAEDDPKRLDDEKLAADLHRVLTAWVQIAADESAGKRKPEPTAPDPEPLTSSRKFKDKAVLDKALADAKVLTFEQFHKAYAFAILDKHCIRCHGGGDPSGHDKLKLDPLAEVRKFIADELPKPAPTPTEPVPTGPTVVLDGGMNGAKMALHIHIHAVTMAFMGMSAAVLMFFTGYPEWVKTLVVPWGLLGAIGDVASWLLMKQYPEAGFAVMTQITGGVFGLLLGVQIGLVFFSMWFGRRPTAAP